MRRPCTSITSVHCDVQRSANACCLCSTSYPCHDGDVKRRLYAVQTLFASMCRRLLHSID